MKRKVFLYIFLVFSLLLVNFMAYAVGEKKAETAEKLKVKIVIGEVKTVDTAAKMITVEKWVKGEEEETVVTVDDNTKITIGKEKKTLADMKVGDTVAVIYTKVDGKKVAKIVKVAIKNGNKVILGTGKLTGEEFLNFDFSEESILKYFFSEGLEEPN